MSTISVAEHTARPTGVFAAVVGAGSIFVGCLFSVVL